jgi:hypothetical protein
MVRIVTMRAVRSIGKSVRSRAFDRAIASFPNSDSDGDGEDDRGELGKQDCADVAGIEPAQGVDAPCLQQSADRDDRDDRRKRETQHGTVASGENLGGRRAREKARAGMKSSVEAADSNRPRHSGNRKNEDRHRGVIGNDAVAVRYPEGPDGPQGEVGENGDIVPDVRKSIAQDWQEATAPGRRANERGYDTATAQSHDDEKEMRDQDDKLHHREISGSLET